MQTMNIVMSSDDNYAQHLGVTIISILANKNKGYEIKFHILDGGISQKNKDKIEQVIHTNKDCSLVFIEIDKKKFTDFPENKQFKMSVCYRMIAPYIIDSDRILYLDSDIIVYQDLLKFYLLEFKGKTLIAIKERSEEYVRKYFFRKISRYFNSGVLLINTKQWQANQVWEKSVNFFRDEKNTSKIKYPDQDILNHLLENDWLEIDNIYNFQLDKYNNKLDKKSVCIFHFVGSLKPWHYLYNNEYKDLYLKYLQISPWRDYKFPDLNLKNKIRKPIAKRLYKLRLKIQRRAPRALVKRIRLISLYFYNIKDSR